MSYLEEFGWVVLETGKLATGSTTTKQIEKGKSWDESNISLSSSAICCRLGN